MATANLPATTETASSALQIAGSLEMLAKLPERLDDRQLALVDEMANALLPALAACPEDHFAKCMRSLAVLPRQSSDDVKGELQFALYRRKLGHFPAEAMSFLVDKALDEHNWFPTIAQCQAILDRWQRSDEAAQLLAKANSISRWEHQRRFEDARNRIRTERVDQAWLDALPPRTVELCEGQGLLWRCPDCGSYSQRGQWRDWLTVTEQAT